MGVRRRRAGCAVGTVADGRGGVRGGRPELDVDRRRRGVCEPVEREGIDYGLETGRLAASMLGSGDYSRAWPAVLDEHYARGFSIARRLALLLTFPRFLPATGPLAMHSAALMTVAVRVMGNFVTEDDADAVARLWRGAGRLSERVDGRRPFT